MRPTAVIALALLLSACSSAYYSTLEQVGIEKRDILSDRVEDARDAQGAASEQFADALEQFRAVVAVDGGDLERAYDRLDREYRRSETRAEAVRQRVDAVEQVAEDLFREWEKELDDYSSAELRRDSERLLGETRNRYQSLMTAMRRAEQSMDPVLEAFEDQVLVLKHNLNARAVGALRGELDQIERDTAALIAEMETAIAEADAFVAALD